MLLVVGDHSREMGVLVDVLLAGRPLRNVLLVELAAVVEFGRREAGVRFALLRSEARDEKVVVESVGDVDSAVAAGFVAVEEFIPKSDLGAGVDFSAALDFLANNGGAGVGLFGREGFLGESVAGATVAFVVVTGVLVGVVFLADTNFDADVELDTDFV